MSGEPRTLDEIVDGERIAVLVTGDGRGRPMTVLEHEGARLWFLTDRTADWVVGLRGDDPVTVVVSDTGESLFASMTGTANVSSDPEILGRLWNPALRLFFESPDDATLIALRVDLEGGEYWDGPSTGVGTALRGLAGIVTGKGHRTMGEQGDVIV